MIRTLLLTLALGACATRNDPVEVLGSYLEAEQEGRYAAAHALLSAEDQAARPLDAYVEEHLAAGPLWRAVATRTAFHVEEVVPSDDHTTVRIRATHPDARAVAEQLRGLPNDVVAASADPDQLMFEYVRNELLERSFPTAEESLEFHLQPSGSTWRLWLGLAHVDAAVRLASRAQISRERGETGAEREALRALLDVPHDPAGGVATLQAGARERLAALEAPEKPTGETP